MRELVILGSSSSSFSLIKTNKSQHSNHLPRTSLLKHTHLSSQSLADHDFALLARSEVNMVRLAKSISKSLRQRNVRAVVDVMNTIHNVGLPPLSVFDALSVDSLKTQCTGLLNYGDLEDFVLFMETLAGFSFPIKQLVDPSTVIKLCIRKRKPHLAVRFACLFPHQGILVCDIIKQFGKNMRDLDSAFAAYKEFTHYAALPNMYIHRVIIDACGLCGDYIKSRYIYQDILRQKVIPNIFVFNSLMNVNAHDLRYTLHVYKEMQILGVTADMTSYNILLKSCSLAGKVDLAQDIYRQVKQSESAGLLKLDDFTYCTIIKIFADAKLWQLALKVKQDMLSSGVIPNTFTWSSLISACANVGLVEQAIKLFEEMIQVGREPNAQCCNILLHACVEARQYDRAFRLFYAWKGSESEDTNSIDHNYNVDDVSSEVQTQRDHIITVPKLASKSLHLSFIKKLPFTPSSTTYNTLMKACGTDYNRSKSLMDEMKAVGISPNHISWSILIDICGSSGNVDGAIQILKNMKMAGVEFDVVAYTTAIKVCVETKNMKTAFSLFAEMKRNQVKPNLVTYDTLLKARTRYGSLKEVQQCLAVYQDMRIAGYKSNDCYLKQLIEEWCEGVIQDKYQSQHEFETCNATDLGRSHSLLLEKVAAHLHNNSAESLSIDLRGLTKVEARIVILAVLRMVKENYIEGHSIEDHMWINLGMDKVDTLSATQKLEVKDAIFELLQNELGLEVLSVIPGYNAGLDNHKEIPRDSYRNSSKSSRKNDTKVSSARRPVILQRLKVTKNSLNSWLQRRASAIRK